MASRYLATARKFATRNEENELNEFNAASVAPNGINSLSSLNSYPPQGIHRAKVSILAGLSVRDAEPWRQSIMAGIRYAGTGAVAVAVIQEDIEVWKELVAHHGWPAAPADLTRYEENEANELKGAA